MRLNSCFPKKIVKLYDDQFCSVTLSETDFSFSFDSVCSYSLQRPQDSSRDFLRNRQLVRGV